MSKVSEAPAVSGAEAESVAGCAGVFQRRDWGWGDVVALSVWTAAIILFFWDAVSLKRALFYFDITEINYPYRAFLADELRAGRFSRWCPGLYCGMPLFSESQAGYLHPLKYLLYPWLATWQAFNLDTILSIWLVGAGTYGWLRRHVGPSGALTGAAIFGASGYVWGHLIHTSMINALASVPLVIWGLESSWASGRWRGVVLGACALACQVFAGHLQDSLFTIGLVVVYGLYRAATERCLKDRVRAAAMAIALIGLGVLISAIQWVPSKELLDRSGRAGGLSWHELTYGSWSPELLPTLVVREAYGTRARDTAWIDGFYPYHEVNMYMGLIAMALAAVGAGGAGSRDRWTTFWVILIGIGSVLILGKYTWLFDYVNRLPVIGSAREPVRFHLWVSLGVAALAATGVDRLARPGFVSLRGGLVLAAVLVAISIPILIFIYAPVWTEPTRWTKTYHLERYRWLEREFVAATLRTGLLAVAAWWVARTAARSVNPVRRARLAAILPILVLADLFGAHWNDVPTVDPSYWTDPPKTVVQMKSDPSLVRVFGCAEMHSGEPGYISEKVDFKAARESLDWSLPLVWGLRSSRGNTPMNSHRMMSFGRINRGAVAHDLMANTHIVNVHRARNEMPGMVRPRPSAAFVQRNPTALPRARLIGKPVYVASESEAFNVMQRLAGALRERLVVEDPRRPLPEGAAVSGTARIVEDLPERVVIETDSAAPAYLVLSDTFDPGWSATVDGKPAPICPAYIAFRAVYLERGQHRVIFTYRPAGFVFGAILSGCGILLTLLFWLLPRFAAPLAPEHAALDWPQGWQIAWFLSLGMIVLASAIDISPTGRPVLHPRWHNAVHQHTWGAGIAAMKEHETK